jgi:hypothetical protein
MSELALTEDILELEGIEEFRCNEWNYYSNNDIGVPRVTHILKQCRNTEGLIQWAANVGKRKYEYYRDKACDIGTIVHTTIDEYLSNIYITKSSVEYLVNYDNIEEDYKSSVFKAFENFKLWEAKLNEYGAKIEEVVGLEIPVTCPWFGGTIDAIVKINGAYYIIDFKTSKNISSEYILQVSSYMWIINNGYAPGLPHIDGIGIIRVDKSNIGIINDLFLNDFNPEHHNIITSFQQCFLDQVTVFYRIINTNYLFDKYSKEYNPEYIYGAK